jgi:thiamine biosynthesis lipoprotein ApbE
VRFVVEVLFVVVVVVVVVLTVSQESNFHRRKKREREMDPMILPTAAVAATGADGETRTSRVVGSIDFVRPTLPFVPKDDDSKSSSLLVTITGVRCSMPFTIKCGSFSNDKGSSSGISARDFEDVCHRVFTLVDETFNLYHPDSEINQINRLPPNVPHIMSRSLQQVVVVAKELVKLTRGAFDPSVAPLLKYYHNMASMRSSNIILADKANTKDAPEEKEKKTPVVVDMETILRQRVVVEHWRGLMSRGFAHDPSETTMVSETVKKLMGVSIWGPAWRVGISDVQRGEKDADDDENHAVSYEICKKHAQAALDLNGIAKGWAVDEIAKQVAIVVTQKTRSVVNAESSSPPPPSFVWPSVYVEWGGDVKVLGCHPSGRPWIVAVPEPPSLKQLRHRVALAKQAGQTGPVYKVSDYSSRTHGGAAGNGEEEEKKEQEPIAYLAILELRHGDAVATSGDYENVLERDGKFYSHVLHPQLGRLLEVNETTLATAVVVAKSCMVADALATAAIAMEDPTLARAMLDPFRTGYHSPLSDYLLYARRGPRIIRLTVPGVEPKELKHRRLQRHEPAMVIVVGSGLAGMAAAIEAAEARAHVIVLEKESKLGGNSAKATSGINGWGTDSQAELGIADEERLFERDTFRSGKSGHCNPSLVRTLSTKSAPAIHWLKHKFHIPLSSLCQLGGHSRQRTHRAPPDAQGRPVPIGWKITKTLQDAITTQYESQIEVRCHQSVTKLLYRVESNGSKTVTGVQVNGTEEILADSVVLCTGGFGGSQFDDTGLMKRFRPDLMHVPTTNGSFAQGKCLNSKQRENIVTRKHLFHIGRAMTSFSHGIFHSLIRKQTKAMGCCWPNNWEQSLSTWTRSNSIPLDLLILRILLIQRNSLHLKPFVDRVVSSSTAKVNDSWMNWIFAPSYRLPLSNMGVPTRLMIL